jgi:hypothetical protein
VFLVKKSGDVYFNHNGGNEGFLCTYYGSLTGGNGVVVMINADDFSIINEVVNSVATVYNWKDFYKPVFKKLFIVPRDSLPIMLGSIFLERIPSLFSFVVKIFAYSKIVNRPVDIA